MATRTRRAPANKSTCWSRSVGERGYTVRVFEIYPGSNLYRAVWIAGRPGRPGRLDRRTLGHRDRRLAVEQAHELIAHLRAAEGALEQDEATLAMLLGRYLSSEAHAAKAERTSREDERKLRRIVSFLGTHRKAVSLDAEDVLQFTRARKEGDARLLGVTPGRKVRNRAVEADLVALRTLLNWARTQKNADGRSLLSANPLYGVHFPKELSPRRPTLRKGELAALLEAAPSVSPLLAPVLLVADGAGRRISAWRQLRWSDVDLDHGKYGGICWPETSDKGKRRMFRPITPAARAGLLALRDLQAARPSEWVLPRRRNATLPYRREALDDLLRKAYRRAGLEPQQGGLWHPFRRGWVNQRKHFPLKDLAAAGGWKSLHTLMTCYLQEDEDTIERVILGPVEVAA